MFPERAGPKYIELLVALLLRDAFYGRFRSNWNHCDVLQLDQVGLDDENSVCWIS